MRNILESGAPLRLARSITSLTVGAVLLAGNAQGQTASNDTTLEEVFVLGRGETRQVQTVTAQQIDQLPPGTSPLKAIENLPGVNFQSADPYGAYEWSTRITVRGFNQNRLGFTLDGVPLGDMTYGNHNGLHVSRAIPSELVERVTLSQGTGSLDTASTSNLGGAVEFDSATPSNKFGASIEQMFGSDSARRTFARLDSGEFGPGTTALIAVTDASMEKWRGNGDQDVRQYTLKLVQPIGAANLTAYYNNSDRMEIDYQDLSLDIIRRRGFNWDNFYPDWNAAVNAAHACQDSGERDGVACDDAYWNASGLRKDDLGYLTLDLPLGENIEWNTTAYLHQNEGQGLWGSSYDPTPGGVPLSVRTTEYDIDRSGVITALTWSVGNHKVNGGVWYETNDFTQARRYYGEPSAAAPTRDFEDFQSNPFETRWEYDFETETVVFHLQDTWSITDVLRINAGFRSVNVENTATTIVGDVKNGTIEADEPFLPQVSINWRLNDELETFASLAKNVRAFASSGTSGPFSTTAAGFNAIRDSLEPETSTNYEVGLRFRGETIDTLFAVYHVDFEDRLLGITRGTSIQGNPTVLANVGSVTSNGVEAAVTWRPITPFSWFVSASWNESEFDDDYTTVNDAGVPAVVPVGGKQVPDAPEILLKSELAYDTGTFFVRADINYTDERFYTYLNDSGVEAYTLLNLGAGYRFKNLGVIEELVLQADVNNATDKEYISTIDSAGFVNSDLNGTAQTLLGGAPRQFFFSAKAKF
jgi:iron complex outermembrane recepter protein